MHCSKLNLESIIFTNFPQSHYNGDQSYPTLTIYHRFFLIPSEYPFGKTRFMNFLDFSWIFPSTEEIMKLHNLWTILLKTYIHTKNLEIC